MIKKLIALLLISTNAFAANSGPRPPVDDAIVNGVTTRAPSQNAVFDALALTEGAIPAGTTLQYFRGDKTFQTLNTAVVPESGALYFTDARARLSLSASAPLSYDNVTGIFSMPAATSIQNGYLSSADWTTFNSKQAAGNYITSLTTDVVASGAGAAVATIQAGAVTNTKLATDAVTNVKVDAAAAIARSKLASGSASHVLINDGSGVMSSEASLAATRGGTAQTTYATGDTIYASASNTLAKRTIGSTGDVNRVVGGIPVWAPEIDPANQLFLYEDWIGDAVGTLRWLDADTGVGVSATSTPLNDSNHPGVLNLNTTGLSGAAIRTLGGVTSGAVTSGFVVGGGALMFEAMVQLSDLATVGEDYNFLMGLSDSATSNVNYIGISYQRSVLATNWICKTVSAGTSTNTDTGVAVVADVWVKLTVTVNAAGTGVDCAFNGVTAVTNTTNIPTVTVAPQLRTIKTAGTAAVQGFVDYFKLYQRYTAGK